jgi:hypothetical protein
MNTATHCKTSNGFRQLVGTSLAMVMCLAPCSVTAQTPAPQTLTAQTKTAPVPVQQSPGQNAPAQPEAPATPLPAEQPAAAPESSPAPLQPRGEELPNSPGAAQVPQPVPPPVGTAAAEGQEVSGVLASKPAGFAIAPARTRQPRSWLIKIGAIVGAGVAVGTVMALSAGSPSRPPNSAASRGR